MLNNDSDSYDGYSILENGSDQEANDLDENYDITEFSSPLKNSQDKITDVSSPDIKIRKVESPFFSHEVKRRKRKFRLKSNTLKQLKHKPCLNFTVSKKDSTILQKEESVPVNVTTAQHFQIDEAVSQEKSNSSLYLIDSSSDTSVKETSDQHAEECIEESLHNYSGYKQQQPVTPECSLLPLEWDLFSQKKPKKGSLLDKSLKVVTKLRKESALYSHEINFGLRAPIGNSVSDSLLVQSICDEGTYKILQCVSQLISPDATKVQFPESADISVIISKMDINVTVDSLIVVHFPFLVMFDIYLKHTFIFTENRVHPIRNFSSSYAPDYFKKKGLIVPKEVDGSKPNKLFRSMKSRSCRNILDAVIGNSLFTFSVLELRVIHAFKIRQYDEVNFKIMAVDSENQFCILHLILSGEKMDSLEIIINGSYTCTGFYLSECCTLTCKMKNIAEYYSFSSLKNDYTYIFEPTIQNWKMDLLRSNESQSSYSNTKRPITPLKSALLLNDGSRVKIQILHLVTLESKVLVMDSSLEDYIDLKVEVENKKIDFPTTPFFVDCILISKGFMVFDQFSMVEA